VGIKVSGTGRDAVLGDVVVRVRDTFSEALHIDTDESNAISATPGLFGEIIL
jgi:putative phosphotransacetylase